MVYDFHDTQGLREEVRRGQGWVSPAGHNRQRVVERARGWGEGKRIIKSHGRRCIPPEYMINYLELSQSILQLC
jgi:hypothetical protein